MSTVTRRVSHAILFLVILLAILAARVSAGEPVLWKQHCPAGHVVQIVPAADWGGVHVLCVQEVDAAAER